MSNAAMNQPDNNQPKPSDFATDDIQPLFFTNAARRRHWRTKLETFRVVSGLRNLTDHVTEERWQAHYAANESAFDAVLNELDRVDG